MQALWVSGCFCVYVCVCVRANIGAFDNYFIVVWHSMTASALPIATVATDTAAAAAVATAAAGKTQKPSFHKVGINQIGLNSRIEWFVINFINFDVE